MKQTILFTIAFGVIIAVFAGIADLEQVAYTTSVLSLPDTTIELSFWIYDGKTESEPLLRETRSVEVRDSRVELDFDPGILAPESVYFVDILAGDDVISSREPLSRPMEPMAVGLQIGKTTEELEILSSRVGIGTTSPSTQLHTTGGVRFAGIGGSGTHLTIDGTGNITRTTISGTVSGSGTNNYISRWTPDGTTLGNSSIWNDGTYVRVIQSSASPVGARFYVQGAPVTTSGSEFLAHIRLAGGSNHYGVLRLEDGGAANALGPVLEVQKYGTGPSATFTGGNVGIGTAAPAHPLHVHGPNTATVLKVSHDIHSGTPAISVGQTSSDKFTVSSTGQITVSSAHSGGNHITVRDGSTMLVKDAQLLFADGSTAAPAYSFISDLNTGIYRPASDQLAFSTAGSERVRVNASGNVGIGTTSPSDRLHVSGGNLRVSNHVDSGNMIYLDDSNNSTGENAHHAIHVQTQGTVQSYLSTNGDSYFSGNMGLGTTTPSTQLHTTGGVRFAGIGGSGVHLTIDGSGNITRTTIPTGTNYWTDHGTYLSPADGEAVYSDGEFYTPSAYGVFHWGNTGIGGQASGWDPPNSDGTGGVWLENTYGEGGGFYADANVACIWSPDYGVRFYDEDALPSGTHNAAIENNGYMTSPRFQDIDNTGYYLDPASTSYLNDVRASIVYDRDNTTYYLNPAGTSRLQYLQNDYYISNPSANYSGAVAFADHIVPTSNGGYDLGQSSYRWRYLHVNGIYLNGDYRNTWPAGDNLGNHTATTTLNMNNNQITNATDIYLSNWLRHSDNDGTYWSNTGWHVYPRDASDMYFRTGSSNGGICGTIADATPRGYIHWTTSNEIGFLNSSRSWSFRVDNSGNTFATTSSRAPIFYDSNNTGYYLDPNSTSNLNILRAYRYRDNAGDYLIRAGTGITVSEDTDGSYLISSSGGGGGQINFASNLSYSCDDRSGWSTGTTGDDTYGGPFNIGFTFYINGTGYTTWYMTTNGVIGFGASFGSSYISNYALPYSSYNYPMIAWFWDDCYTTTCQYTTLGSAGNRICYIYMGFYRYGQSSYPMEAMISLHEGSNLMEVVYEDMDAVAICKGNNATFGFQVSGSEGYPVGYNAEVLDDNANRQFMSFCKP